MKPAPASPFRPVWPALALLVLAACNTASPVPPTPPPPPPGPFQPAPAAPAPAPRPKAPEPPPPAVSAMPDKVILDGMVLKSLDGGWKLEPEGLRSIREAVARARAAGTGFTVRVSGYTSSTGSRAYNLAVSRRRAAFVAKALARAGVPTGRITVLGLGPDHPLADNETKEGRLKNQRVEVEFLQD